MKFIDKFTEKKYQKASKHRIANCPYPDDCCPMSYSISKTNQGGACAGLIPSVDHLDCIRLCIFYTDLEDNKVKVLEHFMTPDEAILTAKILLATVGYALDFSSEYQKHYRYLCKIRK